MRYSENFQGLFSCQTQVTCSKSVKRLGKKYDFDSSSKSSIAPPRIDVLITPYFTFPPIPFTSSANPVYIERAMGRLCSSCISKFGR